MFSAGRRWLDFMCNYVKSPTINVSCVFYLIIQVLTSTSIAYFNGKSKIFYEI